jgi:hypothetical protein
MYLLWIEEISVERLQEHMAIAEGSLARPYPSFMKVVGMWATMGETGYFTPLIILDVEDGKEQEVIREINARMLQYAHLGTRWRIKVLWTFKEMYDLVGNNPKT